MTWNKSWQDLKADHIKTLYDPDNEEVDPVYHEITWWIEQELTIEQWSELDQKQCDVFESMGITKYSGVAGPIPGLDGEKYIEEYGGLEE